MRLGLWALPLTLLLGAGSAWAQDDEPEEDDDAEEGKEGDEEDKSEGGGMMEDTGRDPAETETWDAKGRFVPKKKVKAKPKAEPEDDEPEEPVEAKATKGVSAEVLIGFGKAPVPGPAGARTPEGTSYGFLLGGHYDLNTKLRLQVRIPWTTVAFDDRSDSALGVPELSGRMVLGEPKALTMSLRLAIGIPIAQGDLDPSTNTPGEEERGNVQQMASAANGYRDPELYQPKRLPITPAFIMRYQRNKVQAGAEAKVIVMPKIGGEINDPDVYGMGTGTLELRTLGLFTFLGGDVAYDILGEKYIGLRGWMLWRTLEPIHFETDAVGESPFQFAIEPRIFAKFGIVTPSVGLVVPLGGQLGGEIMGLRLHANFVF